VGAFETVIEVMRDLDMFTLGFPFLLVFVLIYGVLDREDFFEEDSITAVASLAFAFMSAGGIYAFEAGSLFVGLAGVVGVTVFVILGLVVVLASAGVDFEEYLYGGEGDYGGKMPAILGIVLFMFGLVSVLWYFIPVVDLLGAGDLSLSIPPGVFNVAVLLLVVGGVVVLIAREDSGGEDEQADSEDEGDD
jgi:hypothetical protein